MRRCNVIMEFKAEDFNLIPSITYHKGKEDYIQFINKIAPEEVQAPPTASQQQDELDQELGRLPSDYDQ